jgi:hypothetical protein
VDSNASKVNSIRLRELGLESLADVVLLALQCLRSGNTQQTLELCRAGVAHFGADPAVSVVQAMAELAAGHISDAESILSSLRKARPTHLAALYTSAWMHSQSGEPALAVSELLELVRTFPDYPGALGTLATLLMPGSSYREVLGYIHHALRPLTYLEIGVETGATLRLAQTAERIVGVDPNLTLLGHDEASERARLYALTSDEFFASLNLATVFDGRPLHLVFIDGMHRFEFALRDFLNVEQWSNPYTLVILHDVLPIIPIVAERDRRTKFWVGDVWKALWLLLELRKDLTIAVIPTAPSGLAIIRGLNREYRHDTAQWAPAIARYTALAYPLLDPGNWPRHLHVVDNSKPGWNEALGRSPS